MSSSSSPPRTVRFEDTCHLIPSSPPPSRLPKLVTKSISLPVPIFKSSSSKSSTSPPASSTTTTTTNKPFALTIPLPILSTKSSFSPTSSRSLHPTTSCLASNRPNHHRPRGLSDPSATPSIPPRRRLSFPQVVQASPNPASPGNNNARTFRSPSTSSTSSLSSSPPSPLSPPSVATVPLRSCCEACYSRVDASLAQEHWTFQWSSAAARKRYRLSTSPTSTIFPWKSHIHHHRSEDNHGNEFAVLDEEGEEREKQGQ